jgi:hypothetical protein
MTALTILAAKLKQAELTQIAEAVGNPISLAIAKLRLGIK